MKNISGDLEKKLAKLGIKKKVEASLIVEEADRKIKELFSERGAENLQAVSFNKGTLRVYAKNNLWAAECQGKISALLSDNIKKVIFTTDTDRLKEY